MQSESFSQPNAETAAFSEDLHYLRLLAIFHYIVGGLTALIGCFPIIHLLLGLAIALGAFENAKGEPPPRFVGWLFVVGAGVAIGLMWALAIAIVVAGRKLTRQTGYTYCLVVAGLECILTPFGTVLGVFTIIVLMRPGVKELFGAFLGHRVSTDCLHDDS